MKENTKQLLIKLIIPIAVFIIFLAIDIITKLVISFNMVEGQSITLIPTLLSITYVQNHGAAFGITFGSDLVNRIIYIIIALLGSGALIFFFIKNFLKSKRTFLPYCLMLMLVGALGNLIDRVFYAQSNFFVVDWIDFFNGSPLHEIWHFVFNIADSCIVVGTFMLIIYFIVDEVKQSKKNKKEKVKEDDTKLLSKDEIEKLNEKEK